MHTLYCSHVSGVLDFGLCSRLSKGGSGLTRLQVRVCQQRVVDMPQFLSAKHGQAISKMWVCGYARTVL
jgi:hypothetical protein